MCHRVMEKCGMVFDGEGEEAGTIAIGYNCDEPGFASFRAF